MLSFHLAFLLVLPQAGAENLPQSGLEALPPVTATPKLGPATEILANGSSIGVITGHAAPLVYDYDKDGVKDLIVGEYGSGEEKGRARIYLNKGSNLKPSFKEFTYLKAAGNFASVPSS
ncbi:MAG: hypothetical protein GY747_04170 [Planctomycetes bacterium]|nr:hypothetical protein [Planctomycetota bacterium]MCP4770496.1 hypothetical protein [Planctomycetota bacterium]MCP4859936.1 hypothetical protein [Planctomycetota bacterium]